MVSEIQKVFKELAEKEGGTFSFEDANAISPKGVAMPYVTFLLKFEYKGHHFQIENSTGTQYVGHMICKLNNSLKIPDFQIDSISHFKNLFVWRKHRIKATSKSRNVLHFLEKNPALKELRSIGKNEKFSPQIICSSKNRTIETKYHLEFDDWTSVLEPLIQLHKDLIDGFEGRIL